MGGQRLNLWSFCSSTTGKKPSDFAGSLRVGAWKCLGEICKKLVFCNKLQIAAKCVWKRNECNLRGQIVKDEEINLWANILHEWPHGGIILTIAYWSMAQLHTVFHSTVLWNNLTKHQWGKKHNILFKDSLLTSPALHWRSPGWWCHTWAGSPWLLCSRLWWWYGSALALLYPAFTQTHIKYISVLYFILFTFVNKTNKKSHILMWSSNIWSETTRGQYCSNYGLLLQYFGSELHRQRVYGVNPSSSY